MHKKKCPALTDVPFEQQPCNLLLGFAKKKKNAADQQGQKPAVNNTECGPSLQTRTVTEKRGERNRPQKEQKPKRAHGLSGDGNAPAGQRWRVWEAGSARSGWSSPLSKSERVRLPSRVLGMWTASCLFVFLHFYVLI